MASWSERSLAELVSENPGRAEVMEELGLDYCCGGMQSLGSACADRGLNTEQVAGRLEQVPAVGTADDPQDRRDCQRDFRNAPLSELLDHIVDRHHAYLREALPRIEDLLAKVLAAHAETFPHLRKIAQVFRGLHAELMQHLLKEEQVLFPMARQLEAGTAPAQFHCGSIANPIRVMEHEHDSAGNALRDLRRLSDDFTLPDDACPTWRELWAAFRDLEQDLHRHIHEENNILHRRLLES